MFESLKPFKNLFYTEKLNENHAERIRFYLSKADTAGHESDRQVFCQYLVSVCGDTGMAANNKTLKAGCPVSL